MLDENVITETKSCRVEVEVTVVRRDVSASGIVSPSANVVRLCLLAITKSTDVSLIGDVDVDVTVARLRRIAHVTRLAAIRAVGTHIIWHNNLSRAVRRDRASQGLGNGFRRRRRRVIRCGVDRRGGESSCAIERIRDPAHRHGHKGHS